MLEDHKDSKVPQDFKALKVLVHKDLQVLRVQQELKVYQE